MSGLQRIVSLGRPFPLSERREMTMTTELKSCDDAPSRLFMVDVAKLRSRIIVLEDENSNLQHPVCYL